MTTPSQQNWKKLFLSLTFAVTLFISNGLTIFAQTPSESTATSNTGVVTQPPIIPGGAIGTGGKLYLPHDTSGIGNKGYVMNGLLPGITSTIIGLVGGLALLFSVVAGIQYIASFSDPGLAEKAKKSLTYALAGVVIASLSYAIVAIISTISVPSPSNATPTPPAAGNSK